ncbi:967_t:CDS:2 [Ambispora leptoticha]|uniref:967_t:CDS:1 n=1 Tax=Ambispora leptoticha TaxID=144679 RepID=A0A9N9G7Z7_9GLOM|nr:967_t:CDS:2 [Ambispora leptoticha]
MSKNSLTEDKNNPSDNEIEWYHGSRGIEDETLKLDGKKPFPSPDRFQQLAIALKEIRALRHSGEKTLSAKNRREIRLVYSPGLETFSINYKMKREMSIPLREILTIKILPVPHKEIDIKLQFVKRHRDIYKEGTQDQEFDNVTFFRSRRFRCKPFESIDSELVQNFVKRVQKAVYLIYVSMNRNPFDIAPGEIIHGEVGKGTYQEEEPRGSVDYFLAREKKLMAQEKEKEDKLLEKPLNIEMNILCKFGIEVRAIKWPIEGSYYHLKYFIEQKFKRPFNRVYCKVISDDTTTSIINNDKNKTDFVDINGYGCSWMPLYTEEEWKLVKKKLTICSKLVTK